MTNSRIMRVLQATVGMLVLAAGWQILSMVFPHYLFPPVPEIISRTRTSLSAGPPLKPKQAPTKRTPVNPADSLAKRTAPPIASLKRVWPSLVLTWLQGPA